MFVGYDTLECDVQIAKYRRVENKKGAFYQLVFPVTPFYAESGGQVGDTGYLEDENGHRPEGLATIKENHVPIHIVKKLPEGVDLHATFRAVVNGERRMATACNHSATHLLHKALRTVLGTHVEQKGSAVGPEGLRFDFSHFSKMTDEQFDAVINVNLRGNFLMTKAVVPYMMEQKYGKIVHCASVSAYNGNFGQSNYAASKAAIMGMTRVQAKELGKYGINVNAIAPGSIMTDMYAAVPEEVKQAKLAKIPLRRYGDPRETAQLYAFLASDEASYVTAQTITIDGGFN